MDERVERGMRRQLAAAPDDRIGWKLALNAPAVMEHLGLEEPALGWLSQERVAQGSHSLAGAARPAVEPELVLEAGENAVPARIGVALEVVDLNRPLAELEEVLAANVFHRAVAFGALVPLVEPGEATFRIGAEQRGRIDSIEPPAETLRFADGFLRRLGRELAPGELVIAGALVPPTPVAPGDVASLTVAGIGSVELHFTDR